MQNPATSSPTAASASPGHWAPVGDVDGDGRPDEAAVAFLHHRTRIDAGAAPDPFAYRLTIRLSGGGRVSTVFAANYPDPAGPAFQTHVVGGADIDGDRRNEVFVQVMHGASVAFLSPFRLVGRRLARLLIGSHPAVLGAYGSVGEPQGFSCEPPLLIVWGDAPTPSEKAYNQDVTRYRLTGWTLRLVSTQHRRVPLAKPVFKDGDFIACPGLPTQG